MPPSSSSVQTGLLCCPRCCPSCEKWPDPMFPCPHVQIPARPLFGVERTRNNSVKEYRCDDSLLTMLIREPVMMWCKKC
uniref:Uncharacterized protein n=1 Tax=Anopheles arabiensis TaxID=7173 RepID=A0A182IHL6_ANOAR